MKKREIIKRIVILASIISILFSGISTVNADTPTVPDAVYALFEDSKFNYEEFDVGNNTNERCWVYKVYFQSNKDGSGYIDVFYVKEVTDNAERTVLQHLMFEPSAKSYITDHFQVYSEKAPWTIIACEVHIEDGLTVITDHRNYTEGSNPKPSPSPIPTPSPTPSPTLDVSPSPAVVIATSTPDPQSTIAPTTTPECTADAFVTHSPQPTASPIVITQPPATSENSTSKPTSTFSGEIKGQQQDTSSTWVLSIMLIILIFTLIIVMIKYYKAKQKERDY